MNKKGILELEKFIKERSDSRELKRAMAIKMYHEGQEQSEIGKLLLVSQSFVSKWNKIYWDKGIEGIKLQHQGSKGYLLKEERAGVIKWIKKQAHLTTKDLKSHVKTKYGVNYNSWQSYCNLLCEAEYSHKKSQKMNPHRDEHQVKKKQAEIKKLLKTVGKEVKSGKRKIFF